MRSLNSGTKGAHFALSLHLPPCFEYASSKGSGESAHCVYSPETGFIYQDHATNFPNTPPVSKIHIKPILQNEIIEWKQSLIIAHSIEMCCH